MLPFNQTFLKCLILCTFISAGIPEQKLGELNLINASNSCPNMGHGKLLLFKFYY